MRQFLRTRRDWLWLQFEACLSQASYFLPLVTTSRDFRLTKSEDLTLDSGLLTCSESCDANLDTLGKMVPN